MFCSSKIGNKLLLFVFELQNKKIIKQGEEP